METTLRRNKDKDQGIGDNIEYKRLTEEESIGDQERDNMTRYSRGSSLGWCARKSHLKSKLKYLPIVVLMLGAILWFTSAYWWPKPSPIVWSDSMSRIVYKKSNNRLVDRFVHLDLKGAAPRAEYLKKLFPLFKEWGATGLLIEWEDTFPYHGTFEKVRHGDAYNDQTVKSILDSAHSAGLKVVPLVQTFGHMEWVLKHKEYTDVREVTRYPQVICPTNNRSLEIVKQLIDDIVKSHKGYIDTIHIGADEAYHVGKECQRCQKRLRELDWALDRLMLEYVTKVAEYAKGKHGLRVMMWHDMFEKTEPSVLRSYKLHQLVEPVLWGYAEYLFKPGYFSDGTFPRFGQVFDHLWIASAFKGANWPDQPFVNIPRYAQNHLGWLQVMNYYDSTLKGVGGIILTGWQRFDHFAMLCELLPPAIPSLVFNLQVIKHGGVTPELFDITRKYLNCEMPKTNFTEDMTEWPLIVERFAANASLFRIPKPRKPALGTIRCQFPGSEIYALIERLRLVKYEYDSFKNTSIARGWLNEYNLHQLYGSVHHAEVAFNMTELLLNHFAILGRELQVELPKVFFEDTVSEWLFENIQIPVEDLKKLNMALVQIKQTTEFRNRPLAHLKLDL